MKNIQLFDFQLDAVADLRTKIDMAHAAWNIGHTPQVISLSAPTGSGKTIIMTALFEQILFGDASHPGDPAARFLWLSDSPDLNEQTRLKIEHDSDQISVSQLDDVNPSFTGDELEAGHIYFINTQKLGKNKQLTTISDGRQYTFWQIVDHTAKEHPGHMYLVIDEAHKGTKTDKETKQAQSIMQKFVIGSEEDGIDALPLIIGMSATSRRFERLVNNSLSTLNRVSIPASKVRESGLLKDDVFMNYPELSFTPDMAMMEAAADDWAEKRYHWYIHNKNNGENFIEPILIVQVEDGNDTNPTITDLGACLKIIEKHAGIKLKPGNVAHTFNGFGTLTANGIPIYYIDPAHIEENISIKVVFFKMNLSTGWDCPRAESIMSFRRATDATYIAQLLGRMVRTPMAKRIPGDAVLNNVQLFLPHFDDQTVNAVIDALKDNDDDGEAVARITTRKQTGIYYAEDPEDEVPKSELNAAEPNSDVSSASSPIPALNAPQQSDQTTPSVTVQKPVQPENRSDDIPMNPAVLPHAEHIHPKTDSQPTFPTEPAYPAQHSVAAPLVPAPAPTPIVVPAKPIRRKEITHAVSNANLTSYTITQSKKRTYLKSLFLLARTLMISKINADATDNARNMALEEIHSYIEKLKSDGRYNDVADQFRKFNLKSTVIDAFGEKHDDDGSTKTMITSDADIEKQFNIANYKLGEGLGQLYLKRYADPDDITAAQLEVVVFTSSATAMSELENKAKNMFLNMFNTYRPAVVSSHNEELIANFNSISIQSSHAAATVYTLPESADFPESSKGQVYTDHLYCKNGIIRIELNAWEAGVVAEEEKRSDFVCWLRNVDRKPWALCVPYKMDGIIHGFYPDILVFRKQGFSDYVIDILEPHLSSDKDNVYKAIGFAEYADTNWNSALGRVQLIRLEKAADGKNHFKRLDMGDLAVRQKVLKITTNAELDNLFDSDGFFEENN